MSTPRSTPQSQFIHPKTLMEIKSLELRARVVMEGYWKGVHRSPYHGFSVEFTEYRQYVVGDDLRYLDWRVLGRTDRLYLKKFEEETSLRCYFLTDNSRSMAFQSTGYSKADYANTLAGTLSYFLSQQGDAVGLMRFDEAVRDFIPARSRTSHLRALMRALEKPLAGKSTDLDAPLQRIVQLVRRRALIVLISDLLGSINRLERNLAALKGAGHDLIVFHLFDPAERDFKFDQSALFHDLETGQEIYVDPEQAQAAYRQRFGDHFSAARRVCENIGAAYNSVATDRPLELVLRDFLRSRQHHLGKHILRRARS